MKWDKETGLPVPEPTRVRIANWSDSSYPACIKIIWARIQFWGAKSPVSLSTHTTRPSPSGNLSRHIQPDPYYGLLLVQYSVYPPAKRIESIVRGVFNQKTIIRKVNRNPFCINNVIW